MSDYISREELIDSLNTVGLSPDYIRMQVYPREVVKMIICDCPKADVRANIHGEWEEVTDYKDDNVYQWHIICSVCRQRGMFESDNFCPNCGADMRGGEE